jgi:hypothetical protein
MTCFRFLDVYGGLVDRCVGFCWDNNKQQTILFSVRFGERFRYRYEHPGWFNGHPENEI